ncbi:MAG: hypothetical protein RLZZ347_702 [Candidatus Parcubacteria bacterium]|jgi:hypothetical protein
MLTTFALLSNSVGNETVSPAIGAEYDMAIVGVTASGANAYDAKIAYCNGDPTGYSSIQVLPLEAAVRFCVKFNAEHPTGRAAVITVYTVPYSDFLREVLTDIFYATVGGHES